MKKIPHNNKTAPLTARRYFYTRKSRQDVWSKKSWEVPETDKTDYKPQVLSREHSKIIEAKNMRYKGIDKAGESGIIKAEKEPAIAFKQFNNGDEVNEFFGGKGGILQKKKSAEGKWLSSLTKDEEEYISDYCGAGYADINDYLRKKDGWEDINLDYVKEAVSHIDSAIEKFELTDDIIVQRGVMDDVIDMLVDEYNVQNSLNELLGKKYIEKGYASTTALFGNSVANSKPVVFELHIPKGVGRGAYVNKHAGQFQNIEYEFLVKRNSSFLITEVQEDIENGKFYIKAVMDID